MVYTLTVFIPENFLPPKPTEAPDLVLVYNLETELYGTAKAAYEIKGSHLLISICMTMNKIIGKLCLLQHKSFK